jgi:HSP20 family protein
MRDPSNRAWGEALELIEHADRLHRQFFRLGQHRARCPCWEPPVDVYESEQFVAVQVALPGVAAGQVELRLDGNILVVGGTRLLPDAFASAAIRRLEIPYGHFERRIELPAGPLRIGRHALQDGCLILMLDKPGAP